MGSNRSGFSMLELVAAMFVLLIIVSLSYKYVSTNIHETEIIRARVDLRKIREASEIYYMTYGDWPSSIVTLATRETGDNEFTSVPRDPWGRAYIIDPFLYKILSSGPNRTLEIPVGGNDGVEDGYNYPGTWAGDDIFESFMNSPLVLISDRAGNWDICTMQLSGRDFKQITSDPAMDYWPCISPDGLHIAYVSYKDGDAELYSMSMAGQNENKLTDNNINDCFPSFSPDGSKLIYSSVNASGDFDLFIMDFSKEVISTSDLYVRKITDSLTSEYQGKFTPDGNRIVYVSNASGVEDIYMMNIHNTEEVLGPLIMSGEACYHPVVSPNGKHLVYHQSSGGGDYSIFRVTLEILANGSLYWTPKELTTVNANNHNPSFTPDGKKIVFSSDAPLPWDATADFEIFMMNFDGSNVTALTNDDYNNRSCLFPPF